MQDDSYVICFLFYFFIFIKFQLSKTNNNNSFFTPTIMQPDRTICLLCVIAVDILFVLPCYVNFLLDSILERVFSCAAQLVSSRDYIKVKIDCSKF